MTTDHTRVVPSILVCQKETKNLCSKGILGLLPYAVSGRGAHGLARRLGLLFCPLILTTTLHMGIAPKPATGGSA